MRVCTIFLPRLEYPTPTPDERKVDMEICHTLSIRGVPKARLLVALCANAARHGTHDDDQLTIAQAEALLLQANGQRLGLVMGRPIYMTLADEEVDPLLYDDHAGDGTAARVIAELKALLERESKKDDH